MSFRTGFTQALGLDPTKQKRFVEVEPGDFIVVDTFPKNPAELIQLQNDSKFELGKPTPIRFGQRAFDLGIVWDWHDVTPDLFKKAGR